MKLRIFTSILTVLLLAACSQETTVIAPHGGDGGDGGNGGNGGTTANVDSITVSTKNITVNAGTCAGTTTQLGAPIVYPRTTDQSGVWSSSDNSVISVTSGGLVTGLKAGQADAIFRSNANQSKTVTVHVTVTACPPAGSYRFKSVAPADTTINANTRFNLRLLVEVPAGKSPDILFRSPGGCVVRGSPAVNTPTGVANEYQILLDVVGTAVGCTDWHQILKFAGDTTVTTTVNIKVVSLPGIVINPPGPLTGPPGTTGMHTCQVTGLSDTRCWFLSTDPSRGAIVQKDSTFATNTAPWGTGFHFGGEWRNIAVGTWKACAFSPSNPSVEACATHIVATSIVGNVLIGNGVVLPPAEELVDLPVPEPIRVILGIPKRT